MPSARVLLTDDEPNIRLMLRTALASVGYEVAEAAADLAGGDPVYLNLLGVSHEAHGRRGAAKKFYGQAIHAAPIYAPAQQNMRRPYELRTFGSTKQDVALGDEADWPLRATVPAAAVQRHAGPALGTASARCSTGAPGDGVAAPRVRLSYALVCRWDAPGGAGGPAAADPGGSP